MIKFIEQAAFIELTGTAKGSLMFDKPRWHEKTAVGEVKSWGGVEVLRIENVVIEVSLPDNYEDLPAKHAAEVKASRIAALEKELADAKGQAAYRTPLAADVCCSGSF